MRTAGSIHQLAPLGTGLAGFINHQYGRTQYLLVRYQHGLKHSFSSTPLNILSQKKCFFVTLGPLERKWDSNPKLIKMELK